MANVCPLHNHTLRRPRGPTHEHYVEPAADPGSASSLPSGARMTGWRRTPGENIELAVPRRFFNSVCGGCHGSISGRELDITTDVDALTGASVSLSRDQGPKSLQ